jgi:hypothetical protein
MRYSQGFVTEWLITPARFERWVNVLADNDNEVAAPELSPAPEELPAVSQLSFY